MGFGQMPTLVKNVRMPDRSRRDLVVAGNKDGRLFAVDADTGKKVWEYKPVRSNHYGAGLLSTAGGIVFTPEQFGQVTVLNARSGKPLWHFNTGDLITASPITYAVDGQQFFAIASGTNIFAFGLQGGNP